MVIFGNIKKKGVMFMEFLKNGTERCPYCGQPLGEDDNRYYCHTEGCGRVFEKFEFGKGDK